MGKDDHLSKEPTASRHSSIRVSPRFPSVGGLDAWLGLLTVVGILVASLASPLHRHASFGGSCSQYRTPTLWAVTAQQGVEHSHSRSHSHSHSQSHSHSHSHAHDDEDHRHSIPSTPSQPFHPEQSCHLCLLVGDLPVDLSAPEQIELAPELPFRSTVGEGDQLFDPPLLSDARPRAPPFNS